MTGLADHACTSLTPIVRTGWSDALGSIQAHLGNRPRDAEAWYSLGVSLNGEGRYQEAATALFSALTLSPHNIGVQCVYATSLMELGILPEAALLLEDVIHRSPGEGWAYSQLASVRYRQGDWEQASQLWECAARLLEDPRDCLENLALVMRRLEDSEGERRCWQSIAQIDPDSPVAQHMLAAVGLAPLPRRAREAYVVEVFDRFAPDFDRVLERLDYRVPDIVQHWMTNRFGPPCGALRILDAGCGTGLCGERLRPFSSELVGIDLSGGMLERAASRGAYHRLEQSELLAFLKEDGNSFDAIVAGDVLCYFGDLAEFSEHAVAALRPGGWIGLSVERADADTAPDGYLLQPHGRFAHTRSYLEQLFRYAFPLMVDEVVLRLEMSKPVQGYWISAGGAGLASLPGLRAGPGAR